MNKNEDRYPLATGVFTGVATGALIAVIAWKTNHCLVATVLLGILTGVIVGLATAATESN